MTSLPPQEPSNLSQASPSPEFKTNLQGRYRWDNIFQFLTMVAVILAIVVLAVLLLDTLIDGLPRLNFSFLTSYPSRKPEQAGIFAALIGTIWIMVLVVIIAFPLGVGAGVYLEEFASDNWFSQMIEINISNLAGVPSIIYGLLGLGVFVRIMEPLTGGRSVLSGALTLSLLILPVIIVATRESLRAVPDSIRLAGFALGSTRWQVVREHVLPMAMPGILTGTILALSRAIGETAPLIPIGALTFVPFVPSLLHPIEEGLRSPFTVLPIQIYNWVSRPQKEFHTDAAAGIVVLLVVLLVMNSIALFLRQKLQKAR
jgi:phosphate transport system permease protein